MLYCVSEYVSTTLTSNAKAVGERSNEEAKTIKEKHNEIMSSINADTQKNFAKVGNDFLTAYQDIERILTKDIENGEKLIGSYYRFIKKNNK